MCRTLKSTAAQMAKQIGSYDMILLSRFDRNPRLFAHYKTYHPESECSENTCHGIREEEHQTPFRDQILVVARQLNFAQIVIKFDFLGLLFRKALEQIRGVVTVKRIQNGCDWHHSTGLDMMQRWRWLKWFPRRCDCLYSLTADWGFPRRLAWDGPWRC